MYLACLLTPKDPVGRRLIFRPGLSYFLAARDIGGHGAPGELCEPDNAVHTKQFAGKTNRLLVQGT